MRLAMSPLVALRRRKMPMPVKAEMMFGSVS